MSKKKIKNNEEALLKAVDDLEAGSPPKDEYTYDENGHCDTCISCRRKKAAEDAYKNSSVDLLHFGLVDRISSFIDQFETIYEEEDACHLGFEKIPEAKPFAEEALMNLHMLFNVIYEEFMDKHPELFEDDESVEA